MNAQHNTPSASPTLKVMRIQSPQLSNTQVPTLSSPHLSSSLILPDSFGVIHIGETFTAYLGALNIHPSLPVTNISVTSSLQTPTRRWPLPSRLENKFPVAAAGTELHNVNYKPKHIPPLTGIDAIVSIPLEEIGQHILRVDVSYGGPDPLSLQKQDQQTGTINYNNTNTNSGSNNTNNNSTIQTMNESLLSAGAGAGAGSTNLNNTYPPRKMLRKFYRFQVASPLHIRELTLRGGESECYVSLAVENVSPTENGMASNGLTISQTEFQPFAGLIAKRIQHNTSTTNNSKANANTNANANANENNDTNKERRKSAVELYDESGRLNPGESGRYLFTVKAATDDAALRGIAHGDELGKAVVTWRKAMGETGRIASTFVYCPKSNVGRGFEEKANRHGHGHPTITKTMEDHKEEMEQEEEERLVVHGSGLSVDVAASAAQRSSISHAPSEISSIKSLDMIFPVTVEPIDPPTRMKVGQPVKVRLLVVNHGTRRQNLQLQMRLPLMKDVVVCGPSFQNLGDIAPEGGSEVASVTLIALTRGLFFVKGCFVVDLNTGMEIKQPALFSILVDGDGSEHFDEGRFDIDLKSKQDTMFEV